VARTCGQCRGGGSIITKPCQTCRGAGRAQKDKKLSVRIPAGIATGQRLRLNGEGEAGPGGGPAGDLYVVVHVQEHPFFQRDGNDLHCEIPLQFPTLALGGEIRIPTLDGSEVFTIPSGTETGTTFRVRGRGMPDVSGRGRGDLMVTVKVSTPKKLTKEQKKLLEQLAGALPKEAYEPTPTAAQGDKGLFDRVKDIFG
jgi:molecular chaperone DnaJ